MISHGHSWSDLKNYSLAELGVFFRVVVELEEENRVEDLSNIWMGSNLEYKRLKEVIDTLQRKQNENRSDLAAKEVNKEWKRLARFMSGIK